MLNDTEIDALLLGTAYRDGLKIGLDLANQINLGHLVIEPNTKNVTIPLVLELFSYEIAMKDKILAKVGNPIVMDFGNGALAVGGGAILLKATQRYFQTENGLAKACYALSAVCSGTGAVSSSIAVFCDRCGLDRTGLLGDGFGGLLLKAGDQIQELGQVAEGKKKFPAINPFKRKNPSLPRKPYWGGRRGDGLAFISPNFAVHRVIHNISGQKIILVTGTIFTTYGYIKLLISSYRYGKKLMHNYLEKKRNYQNKSNSIARVKRYSILKPVQVLVTLFYSSSAYQNHRKVVKIYRFAMALSY